MLLHFQFTVFVCHLQTINRIHFWLTRHFTTCNALLPFTNNHEFNIRQLINALFVKIIATYIIYHYRVILRFRILFFLFFSRWTNLLLLLFTISKSLKYAKNAFTRLYNLGISFNFEDFRKCTNLDSLRLLCT